MKNISKIGLALVLATTLTIGCGGGGDAILKIITQGDAESCLTDATFMLLVLSDKLDGILDEIEGDDLPNITVNETSEDIWSFDCSFALLGIGDPDTRMTGTIVLTDGEISPGSSLEVNDVVISSLGGPLTGNADVDVELGENSVTFTGSVNLFNSEADCDIMLSMPTGFTLARDFVRVEDRQLAAEFGGLLISGVLEFGFDFGPGPDLNGSMTVPQQGQDVTVATELLGEFTFKIFPENRTLLEMIPCLFNVTDTIDELVDGLEDVIDEATGEVLSDDVTIDNGMFHFDNGDIVIDGTITLVPPSVDFAFSDDSGVQGESKGPISISLPAQGSGTVNGELEITVTESPCTATFSFLNTRFDAESFEDFIGGRTLLVLTVGEDTIELDIDEGAEGDDSEFELDGVILRLNGVELSPIAIIYLIFTFGDVS